ncbi:uncharacterized protein RJT21DRAFT_118015 [Scheffersomyces amazonensis]|uniref:uncharacterized protein n=1 Tax=Scheffersomyces amazonensis TaxID=1078765 RepID=UPI00315CA61F
MDSTDLDELDELSSVSPKPESRRLLDSFNSPGSDDEEGTSLQDLEVHNKSDKSNFYDHIEDDTRLESTSSTTLGSSSQEPTSATYPNIMTGGTDDDTSEPISSSASVNQTDTTEDLERQTTRIKLTTRQRIMNIVHHLVPIKQTYERINNGLTTGRMQTNTPGRFIGQGTDGVFRNLMAKPDTESTRQEQEIHPPSYEEAAADATPEYWESAVIAPMYEDEVFVEGLPVGNMANFVWNGLVTVAFQFVGFVLCYLLHTSHAAKQGSRAGLGITFILYGYQMIPSNFGHSDRVPDRYEPNDPNSYDIDKMSKTSSENLDTYNSHLFQQHATDPSSPIPSPTSTPYFAYGIIAFGVFIILKSIVDYYKVKQIERAILSPPSNNPVTVNTTTDNVETYEEPDTGHA